MLCPIGMLPHSADLRGPGPSQYLENEKLCVVTSATVSGAFRQMVTKDFDALITDLHTRRTREGLRLVTAIRHLQPEALIVAVSDSLDVQQAMKAIRLGVDSADRFFLISSPTCLKPACRKP
jgi:DNA-binding NarL/FixJ family response regulator